ncbi:OadG family protein [Chloroflexota bacterium]
MAVDWGFAGQIGSAGFGTVFSVLVILSIVIWLTGLILRKIASAKEKTDDNKKGVQNGTGNS